MSRQPEAAAVDGVTEQRHGDPDRGRRADDRAPPTEPAETEEAATDA